MTPTLWLKQSDGGALGLRVLPIVVVESDSTPISTCQIKLVRNAQTGPVIICQLMQKQAFLPFRLFAFSVASEGKTATR